MGKHKFKLLKDKYLHFESHAHLFIEGAQIDLDHTFNERRLINVIVGCLPELAKEAIIDDAGQLGVLKEGHFVDEL